MTEQQKGTYLAWLNDAHAMELGLVKTLDKQVKDTASHPALQERIQEHLDETKTHARMIEECIERLGGDPSTGKDWLAQITSTLQGMAASLPEDALVKNLHASYTAEHFEIAAYTLLEATAQELGDIETAEACRAILVDEQAMADYLIEELPRITTEHLQEVA